MGYEIRANSRWHRRGLVRPVERGAAVGRAAISISNTPDGLPYSRTLGSTGDSIVTSYDAIWVGRPATVVEGRSEAVDLAQLRSRPMLTGKESTIHGRRTGASSMFEHATRQREPPRRSRSCPLHIPKFFSCRE
jgi:hypothetical protein